MPNTRSTMSAISIVTIKSTEMSIIITMNISKICTTAIITITSILLAVITPRIISIMLAAVTQNVMATVVDLAIVKVMQPNHEF